ncbi:MAG: response regulator transcription factor [Clostridia bacterium]|nr:response regulator transcription factor [Clostridia bacterium]
MLEPTAGRRPYSILVADDDARICRVIEQILSSDGMRVVTVRSGREAVDAARRHAFDLILLDVMYGAEDVDGFGVIEELRRRVIDVPIFLISALAEESDKIYGLGIGADDYITKPFSALELLYRVKATLRRYHETPKDQRIERYPFVYLRNEMRLFKQEKGGESREIPLTTKESQMMLFFLLHPNWVVTTEQLYEAVWCNRIVDSNTVMVHISRLRNKIEENPRVPLYIKTIRGIGYQFVLPGA